MQEKISRVGKIVNYSEAPCGKPRGSFTFHNIDTVHCLAALTMAIAHMKPPKVSFATLIGIFSMPLITTKLLFSTDVDSFVRRGALLSVTVPMFLHTDKAFYECVIDRPGEQAVDLQHLWERLPPVPLPSQSAVSFFEYTVFYRTTPSIPAGREIAANQCPGFFFLLQVPR